MNNIWKRSLSFAMALVMVFSMLPVNALAVEADPTDPTQETTVAPTEAPTEAPTQAPTEEPTQAPTEAPTEAPTQAPTETPTEAPTEAPTEEPTEASLSGETRKIYFLNEEGWDAVYAAWSFDEEAYEDAAFPGVKLTADAEMENVWHLNVPVEADQVLFNDGVEVTEALLAQEAQAGLNVTHEIDVRLTAGTYSNLYAQGAWLNYAQELAEQKAAEETEPETEAPTENPAVAEVEAMIAALPTEVNSQEEYDALVVTLGEIDEIVEDASFPAEAYQNLDWAKIEAAYAALDTYDQEDRSGVELAASCTWTKLGGTGTEADPIVIGIKNATSVSYADIYIILSSSSVYNAEPTDYVKTDGWNGIGNGTYQGSFRINDSHNRFDATDSNWGNAGDAAINIESDTSGSISTGDTVWYAWIANRISMTNWNQGEQKRIKFVTYYTVTVDIVGCDTGSVSYNGNTYDDGDSFNFVNGGTITVNDVEGYTYTNITQPTTSGTLTVNYAEEQDTDSTVVPGTIAADVSVTVNGNPIGEGATVSANESVVVAATYTGSSKNTYVSSVTVSEGNNNVGLSFTAGEGKTYTVNASTADAIVLSGTSIGYNDTTTAAQAEAAIKALITSVEGKAYTDTVTVKYYYDISVSKGWATLDTVGTLNSYSFGDAETERVQITCGDYVWEGNITLTEDRTSVTPVLNAAPYEVTMNGFYEASELDATAQATLKAAIRAEVVGSMAHDGTVTITAYDGAGAITGWYDIFNGSANFFVGSETIKIKWSDSTTYADYETAEITLKVTDSRSSTAINAGNINFTADSADAVTADAIETALAGSITVTDTYNTGVTSVDWSNVTVTVPEYTFPTDGNSVDVTVTVSLAGTADYQGATKNVTVTIINPVYGANITASYPNGALTIAGITLDGEGKASDVTPGTYNINVTTDEGYTFKSLSIVDEDGATVDAVLQTDGSYKFTVEAAATAAEAKTYTITATATLNEYQVTFNSNGGSAVTAQDVNHGATATKPADPTKEGHEFKGWFSDAALTQAYDFTTTITGNITLYAKWEANEYTITFVTNADGITADSITAKYGESITLPILTGRAGWTFLYWCTDVDLNNQVSYTTMPVNGATLYAKWTEAASSITFNTNGGTTIEAILGNNGDSITKPADPTKEGHIFAGWYTDEALTKEYTFGTNPTLPETPITLYAKWNVNSYTITFVANGGELADGATTEFTIAYGADVTATYPAVSKTGHSLTWDKEIPATMPAEDVTITAQWTPIKYTITFVNEDGTTVLGGPSEVAYGTVPTAPANPTKADTAEYDYGFSGWKSSVDNKEYASNAIPAVTGDTTYTAVYSATKQKYTITFNNWDGTLISSNAVEYGTTPTAPTGFSVPANHTFAGWDKEVVAVTGEATYTATYTLNASNGTVCVNGSVTEGAKLDNLKNKVLTAAGLPTNGNYTVEMVTGAGNINVESTSVLDKISMYTRFNVGDNQGFVITDNTTGVSASVIMEVVDSRLPATVDTLERKDFGKFNTQSEFETAVKNEITASWKNRENVEGKVTSTSIVVTFSDPVDSKNANGETVKTYTVTVNVIAGTDWLATEQAVTFENVYWTVNQYTVTWYDEDGTTSLWTKTGVDYGTVPTYGGEIPTKASTVSQHFTFASWEAVENVDDDGKIIGDASFKAVYEATPRSYVVKYIDHNKVWQTGEVVYGGAIPQYDTANGTPTKDSNNPEVAYTHSGWELTSGTVGEGNTVVGDLTYTATFSTDTIYTVTFKVNGEVFGEVQYINVTQNPNAVVTDPGTPDKNNEVADKIFAGWDTDIVGKTPTASVVVNATWTAESNNNNVLDENETITVNVAADGSLTISDVAVANGSYVFDSTKTHTVVITPPANHYVASVSGIDVSAASYNNGVMTISNVTLTNGAEIEVTFAEWTIPANGNMIVEVNGYSSSTIFETITKENVLKAIMGDSYNGKSDEYTITMTIGLASIKQDNALLSWLPDTMEVNIFDMKSLGEQVGSTAASAIESLIRAAFDINESEVFTVTWDSTDESKPVVSGTYTISLKDNREYATAWLKEGKGEYSSSDEKINELLEQIQKDLETDTNIIGLSWKEPLPTFEPGESYDLVVIVKVGGSETLQANDKVEISVKVSIPVVVGSLTIPESAVMIYNTSMTDAKLNEMVEKALNDTEPGIVLLPDELKDYDVTVYYLARAKGTVPVRIQYNGVGGLVNIDETIDVPVEALWLNIGEEYPDVGEAPSQADLDKLVEDMIDIYGMELLEMSETELKNVFLNNIDNYPELKKYITYIGTHEFGYNTEKDANGMVVETVYLWQADYGYTELKSNTSKISLNDQRYETYIVLNENASVTYGFSEADLLKTLDAKVYAKTENGDILVGSDITLVTNIEGMGASEAAEITVKYAGDADYQYSTATGTIVINKATVNVEVDDRLIKWYEGISYALPVVTNPAGVDTINFIAGLNVEGVNIDGGVKGFVAQVQLLLPEELQSLLASADVLLQNAGVNVSFADGASMKLSELQSAVEALDDLFAGSDYEEYFRVLLKMLQSLPTETADIEIIVGGELPTDIGVYVVGAISADANYTTDFAVGAVVIYPDGTKVDLAWNQNDENYIITNSLLNTKGADGKYLFDTGATAYERDTNYTVVDEAATAQVAEMFLGVDIDGNITIESDQTKLNVGAYVEVAMTADWGNTMYYCEPILRPIVVVAETLKVDYLDENGNINNERVYEFDNTAKNGMEGKLQVTYDKDGEGYKAGDAVTGYNVKYVYAGVRSNGEPYASTSAPVHAGAYTITALVTVRDNQNRISHAGVGIGALVITPTESDIAVGNKVVTWDGNEHGMADEIVATSKVAGLTPDTTIISVGLSADLDSIDSLQDINGTVNVDMPAWLDNIMTKLNVLEAGYADGITASTFLSYVDKIDTALTEQGIELEAFDEIVSVIEQLPVTTVLTFHDDAKYSEVGAYLYIGIVTDSDHYPSAGAGILVITPDGTKVQLQFEEDWNGNNIFTWNALENMNLEAGAYDLDGTYNAAASEKVVNLYFGFTDNGEFLLASVAHGESLKDRSDFDNGLYTQMALVADVSNTPYYAEPITRAFVVVPNPATVEFVDENGNVNNERHFVFNNQPYEMAVRVTVDGKVVENAESNVTVRYVGVQSNGELWNSSEAPVHAGCYTVTAVYTATDDLDRIVYLGAGVGVMVIEPTSSTMDVESKLHEYDGNPVATDVLVKAGSTVEGLIPDKTVITTSISTDGTFSENLLNAITSEVNVDFPEWVDEILTKYAPSIYEANGVKAGEFGDKVMAKLNAAVADAEALAEQYDIPADKLIDALNTALAEVQEVVDQLPEEVVLTFKDQADVAPKAVGTYLIIGIVTDSDHYPSMDVGVLVIYPKVTKATLDWYYKDLNGIITLPALSKIDLTARGYVDGVEDAETNAMIAHLTVGIDENGNLVVTSNPNGLTSNGAYTEVAYIPVEIGAEMTVAAPIMRSFLVVPQTVTVEVTDTKATFGETYEVPVTVTKQDASAVNGDCLTVTYIGVNASAGLYHSNEKPTSAGIYTVIATYVEKNGNNEYAYVGMDVGVLTIAAAPATVDVENEIHVYDGDQFNVMDLITKSPEDAKIAVITAALNVDGDFSEDGILAVGTSVNIDFPARADEVIEQILPEAYTDGIELNPFFQKLDEITEKLVEVGFNADAVAYLKNQLEQLPSNTKLTFKEQSQVNPSAIGVYLVGAVVMDPDYVPTADAGLLVITNDITLAELKWNYRDDNNIITRAAIAEMDMAASAYVNDVLNAENTDRIDYIVLGAGTDGSIVLTTDPADIKNLPNGVYTEIAFIYQEIDATMTLAIPIQRTFTIVEHTVDVIFDDVNVTYDGKQHAVEVTVKDLDKNVIDRPENLTVTYINLGAGYYSTTAPTNVGSYTVIAKYEEYINGDLAFFGMEIGNVTITPADADYTLTDTTVVCGTENAIDGMITNTNNLPYAIYIVKNVAKGEVNVILPAGWEITLEVGATVDDLVAALEKLPAVIENTKIVEALKSVLNSIDMQTLTINGAQPSEYGEYEVTAIAFGNLNYNVAKASAVLTVDHAGDTDKDHKCDVCGETAYGTCEDADNDHDCDYGCDKVYGTHEDTDLDHECDYGCSESIGTCEDADKDHDCDYGCDEVYGTHEDTNNDHVCDYGCSESIGTCEDADKDHDCDYGCGEVYGTHEDTNNDHDCDYGCSESIGTCEDADKDHDCDYGCDKVYGTHEDTNNDHVCDYGCSEPIGEHVDSSPDGDHVCDYGCGETLTECADADNDGKCDDCGADLHIGKTPIVMDPADSDTIKVGSVIYVDGKPYELDDNYTAWIDEIDATKGAMLVTTYRYKDGNTAYETYPTNMYVWYVSGTDVDGDKIYDSYDVERVPELDDFFKYEGTSIRVGSAKNGIRFFTSVNASDANKLLSGSLITSGPLAGVTMTRAGTVFKKNVENVNLDNGVSSDVYGGKAGSDFRVFSTVGSRNWFTGMLVGLETDAETIIADIATRPYAVLEVNGESFNLYGGMIQRSIFYVATQNKDTFAAGSSYDNFVEGLISKGMTAIGEE